MIDGAFISRPIRSILANGVSAGWIGRWRAWLRSIRYTRATGANIPINGRMRSFSDQSSLSDQKRYKTDTTTKNAPASLESKDRKRQAATNHKLLTESNRVRIQNANMPKKKYSASCMVGK